MECLSTNLGCLFQAEKILSGTVSSEKNEILFKECETNYNNELPIYRKGTVLVRKLVNLPPSKSKKHVICPLHVDIIGDSFWEEYDEILSLKDLKLNKDFKPDETFYLVKRS